jgi:hypothetical protein
MLKNKLLIFMALVLISNLLCYGYKPVFKTLDKSQLYELIPSPTRFVQNLSGKWEISVNGGEWEKVSIPFYLPDNNVIELKRTLKIDKSILYKSFWHLYFLGLDDEIEVYINNQYVGRYFGNTVPFTVKIPPKMIVKETNILKLKIMPAKYKAKQIKEQNLYTKNIYTGIFREILLIGTPHIWIADLKYKLDFSENYSKCSVNALVELSSGIIDRMIDRHRKNSAYSEKNNISVSVRPSIIKKNTGQLVAEGAIKKIEIENERTVNLDFNISVLNPELWEIENPVLYRLVVKIMKDSVVIDEFQTDLGFREIKSTIYQNSPVLVLNGKVFEIKGVDYIDDYYHTGQSLSARRIKKDLDNIKTLGANLLRVKYGFPHPYLVKKCNENGIFILVDLPVYDVPNMLLSSDEIKVRMKNIAKKMISSYTSNPSVFAWVLYEGLDEGSDEVQKFENFIMPVIRNNSYHPVCKSTLLFSDQINSKNFDFIIIRQIGKIVPVDDIKEKIVEIDKTIKKPILFNFGMTVQPDNHKGYADPFSTEAQANYIFNLFNLSKSLDLAGNIIWSYNDYILNNPMLIINNNDKKVCTSGLMDRYRQQRLSYLTVQSLFNKEKDTLFYAGSYEDTATITFIIYGLIVSLAFLLLINRFKRFREYLFRSLMRPYNFYADIRDQRIISAVQTYILGLIISFTLGIFLSALFFFYKSNELAQYIYMLLLPDSGLQEYFYNLIWMPGYLIPIVSLIIFVFIFLLSALIKFMSLFVRGKIFFSDTYIITIWSGSPILLLLPISIILDRLLMFSSGLIWIVIPLSLIIILWVILRVFRAVSVVFDIRAMFGYLIGFALLFIILAFILSIYEYSSSIIEYTQYLVNVF